MPSSPILSLDLPQALILKLSRAGYKLLADLRDSSVESLTTELEISTDDAQTIFSRLGQSTNDCSLTHSASRITGAAPIYSSKSPVMDEILSGGLRVGHILEISGPPGTPKEIIAINIVSSFVESGHEVLFVDCQNMTSPAKLYKMLQDSQNAPSGYTSMVYHFDARVLHHFMVLIHKLPSLLDASPKVMLLVINSVSFPFQAAQHLSVNSKNYLLEKIKKVLIKASFGRNLTIVTTSQLSTKILNADGSLGNFDTGTRGVMVPLLGQSYISSGRTHRVSFVATGPTSGFIKLLPSSKQCQVGINLPSVAYEVTRQGEVVGR